MGLDKLPNSSSKAHVQERSKSALAIYIFLVELEAIYAGTGDMRVPNRLVNCQDFECAV